MSIWKKINLNLSCALYIKQLKLEDRIKCKNKIEHLDKHIKYYIIHVMDEHTITLFM